MDEYRLQYTGLEIDEKLQKVDSIEQNVGNIQLTLNQINEKVDSILNGAGNANSNLAFKEVQW